MLFVSCRRIIFQVIYLFFLHDFTKVLLVYFIGVRNLLVGNTMSVCMFVLLQNLFRIFTAELNFSAFVIQLSLQWNSSAEWGAMCNIFGPTAAFS